MIDPRTNHIAIEIKTVDEAPNYRTGEKGGEDFKEAELIKAVVVRNGMENGKDTIDLQFVDPATGQKFVIMKTATLIQQLASVTNLGTKQ